MQIILCIKSGSWWLIETKNHISVVMNSCGKWLITACFMYTNFLWKCFDNFGLYELFVVGYLNTRIDIRVEFHLDLSMINFLYVLWEISQNNCWAAYCFCTILYKQYTHAMFTEIMNILCTIIGTVITVAAWSSLLFTASYSPGFAENCKCCNKLYHLPFSE